MNYSACTSIPSTLNNVTPAASWTDDGYLEQLRTSTAALEAKMRRAPFRIVPQSSSETQRDAVRTQGDTEGDTSSEGYASPASPKTDFVGAVFATVQHSEPKAAAGYYLPEMRLLVALCAALQQAAGENPFYLSCRDAGRLLRIRFQLAAKYLRKLVRDGILERGFALRTLFAPRVAGLPHKSGYRTGWRRIEKIVLAARFFLEGGTRWP